MKRTSVVRIAAAAVLLCLVASCKGTDSYAPANARDAGFVLMKTPEAIEGLPASVAPDDREQISAPEPTEPEAGALETVPAEQVPEDADLAGKLGAGRIARIGAPDEALKGTGQAEIKVVGGSAAEREAVADLYLRAQKYFYDGDLAAARRLLSRIRKGQPYYDIVHRLLQLVDAGIAEAVQQAEIEKEQREHQGAVVEALFRDAERAYNAKMYGEAVRIVEEAYRLDPQNPRVRSLRADARIAKANADMYDNSLNQDARIAEVMSAVEKVGTVPSELARAPRPEFEEEPDPDAEAARILEEKLNQLVTVNLDTTPLDYLLNIMFRATGVNIIANPKDLEGKELTLHVHEIKLIELLNYISTTLGVTFTRSGNAIWLQSGGDVSPGPAMDWHVIPLNKGLIDVSTQDPSDTSDLEKILNEAGVIINWPGGSEYRLDRKTNKLFVRTTSEAMEEFTRLVGAVDVTPVQVLIETKFIEISSKDFFDLGIEWHTTSDFALSKKNGSNKIQIDAGMGVTLPAPVAPGADFPSGGFGAILAGVMTVPQFQLTLNALKATGHTSTLGEPRLIAVNNLTAEIAITRDLYYVDDIQIEWEPVPVQTTGPQQQSIPIIEPEYTKAEDVGFKLTVRPSVGRDLKNITLYLQPTITDLVEMLETPVPIPADLGIGPLYKQQPIISTRELKAKVTVSDGYVVVLGGLVRQTKEKGEVKVPILGDIPLLGALFRHETEKNIKTNLLIFVSAKIITPEGRMYVGAGPGTLNLGGPSDEARELLEQIEVEAY